MRRTAALLAVLLSTAFLLGQGTRGIQKILGANYTVATLPTSSAPGTLAIITDGNPGCLAGGGATYATCLFNGSAWTTASGGANTFDQLLGGNNISGAAMVVTAPSSLTGNITAQAGAFTGATQYFFSVFGASGSIGNSLCSTDAGLTVLTCTYTGGLSIGGSGSGKVTLSGLTSGSAAIQVAAVAGTPNPLQLPIATGAIGQFPISDGGNPQQLSWSNYFKNNAQTGTYQVLAADFQGCKTIPVASGTFTVTLVASGSQPADGQCIRILNYGAGTVTVARSGQNINGAAANLTIAAGSASAPNGLWVVSDAANYFAQPLGSGSGSSTPCTVTASSLQYNNAGAFGCVTDFTFSGHTITSAAAGLLDLSAQTGIGSFKVPVVAGFVPTANGSFGYDSTANLFVGGVNGSTGKLPYFTGANPTNNDCAKWTTGGVLADQGAACNAGTVTSVAATVPGFLSVSGSPITTSGTLAFTSNLDLVDAQTGTSYTIVAADCGKLATFNNAAATAVTLPQATGSFVAPCSIGVENLGAGVVTITPTTSTIAGLTAIALNQNQGVIIKSDSTNYQVLNFTPSYLPVAAQVNTLQVGGTATATDPFLQSIGSDTNIGERFLTKGTGQVTFQPASDNSNFLIVKNAAGTVQLTIGSTTGSIRLGATGTPGAQLDVASKYFVNSGGVNTKYNNINTVSNGHPSEYATVDLTAQSAAITATTLYAVPAAANGMYRVCFVAKVTTAATTSSTLGGAAGFQLTYTDQDDSVVVTTLSGAFWDSNATNIALNTTQAHMGGCTVVNAKASTNIQYQMGYTSSGGTAMQYNLHIKAEAL